MKMTWENADLECKRPHQDAYLVYIESEEESKFVFSSVISVYDHSFWIGLSDEYTEGNIRKVTLKPHLGVKLGYLE